MSIGATWYTLDEAVAKFGVEEALVLQWVETGVVRCEMEQGKVSRVNIDDLELKLEERLQEH